MPTTCVLGTDFFNATVHFHPSGSCYQTTPGVSMGRAGYKQPGYRSVMRVVKPDSGNKIKVLGKQVHGEWRMVLAEEEGETTSFEADVSPDGWVDGTVDADADAQGFRAWQGTDLASGAWDVMVVVWQWCRGVPERHGNLMALGEEWWCPYLADANKSLEEGFARGDESCEIQLLSSSYMIHFTKGQSFALQVDAARGKERAVRRTVKTIQEVKVMLDKMASPPLDPLDVAASLGPGEIPQHFLCCITQDIMVDPVKTVDGMVYDRPAIERWFQVSPTSPLTGLPLSSLTLTPNVQLREQIEAFVKEHADKEPAE